MEYRRQGLVNQQLFKMSEETGIELVATNDIHYTYAEDAKHMIFYFVFRPERSFQMRIVCGMTADSIM